jgi:hypothetical protein
LFSANAIPLTTILNFKSDYKKKSLPYPMAWKRAHIDKIDLAGATNAWALPEGRRTGIWCDYNFGQKPWQKRSRQAAEWKQTNGSTPIRTVQSRTNGTKRYVEKMLDE